MKSFALASLTLVLFAGCDRVSLSNQEALEIIRQQKHYPRPIEYQTEFSGMDPGLEKAFETLKSNGMVEEVSMPDFMIKVGDRRNKGLLTKNIIYGTWTIRCNLLMAEPVSIEEILIDKQNQTARVRYVEAQKPLEPAYSLLYRRNNTSDPNAPKPEQFRREVSLKKWDQGWRIIE
jgi:hypothetical protein